MPFILNALKKKKKAAHCFPAGNCSIIKYVRFQSDDKKSTPPGLPVKFTVYLREQQEVILPITFPCQTLPATHTPKRTQLKTTST